MKILLVVRVNQSGKFLGWTDDEGAFDAVFPDGWKVTEYDIPQDVPLGKVTSYLVGKVYPLAYERYNDGSWERVGEVPSGELPAMKEKGLYEITPALSRITMGLLGNGLFRLVTADGHEVTKFGRRG